jgi:flavin reductase (DIM6/NTAB) family NADH-FMN oxidoreductase RutF
LAITGEEKYMSAQTDILSNFTPVNPESAGLEPIPQIGKGWMLITAGAVGGYNTMTASWGGLGVLWASPVCFAFVRHSRLTYEFIEREACFTLSFFDERYRAALQYCGAHSGREGDKAAATGLTPIEVQAGTTAFAEASRILVCRTLYKSDIGESGFVDRSILKSSYADNDFHRMYVGRIESCLERKTQA